LFDLSNYATVNLSFNYFFREYSFSSGTLSYSINGGTTWVEIESFTTTSANPALFSQSIPAAAGQSLVKFKWNYMGAFAWYWAIDDVQITGLPVNRQLSGITIPAGASNCYNASQTITVAGSGTFFTVEDGGSATLIAGLKINMLPGASVKPGGHLSGYIAPSGPFCASPGFMSRNPDGNITENDQEMPANNTIGAHFKVYPNPNTGKFTLVLSSGGEENETADILIYSLMGNTVLKEEMKGILKTDISLSDKPNGIYIIQVVSGNRTGTAKIIKQ
jgi:hypothetical protein